MAPRTLLEAVQECPDIYELAVKLEHNPDAQWHWGVIPHRVDFLDRPTNEMTLITIPSTASRLEAAYREAVRHAYPYVKTFGTQNKEARPVAIAVPDLSATSSSDVIGSLVEQLAVLFCLDGVSLGWRSKLEVMRRIAYSGLSLSTRLVPLAYVVDIDRVIHHPDTAVLIDALKCYVVRKHGGQIVFYTSSDISVQLGLGPWRIVDIS
ncbi:hypothetical protein F5Y09DRAFT_350185 [Xylaria sp. FL1042]|nr:hypothetical protein F5Y09DRAFT_350185 [Xylaria sp. FL1042]